MHHDKPIIGIPLKRPSRDVARPRCRQLSFMAAEIGEAVLAAGAIPIEISCALGTDLLKGDDWKSAIDVGRFADAVIPQLEMCDGILLAGGETSEAAEPAIARWAYENNVPCLGICAGQNNISRTIGGTTRCISDPDRHNVMDEYVHGVHPRTRNLVRRDRRRRPHARELPALADAG